MFICKTKILKKKQKYIKEINDCNLYLTSKILGILDLLSEGSLYAIGGYKLDSIERFDPREGKWVSLDYLNVRRRRVQAVLYDK